MSESTQKMDTVPDNAESNTKIASKTSKRKATEEKSTTINFTSRNPPWTYLKLQLISHSDTPSTQTLDALSARTYLSAALSQFLGLTGTAIPIDILKVEPAPSGTITSPQNLSSATMKNYNSVWVRIPRDDAAAVVAALSSWVGSGGNGANIAWRVCAKGNFLGALVAGSGRELFVP
ncbi:hypothetical protein N7488_009960 [Penicillium malachiteum]|nr:hypothetical protein N7488_009960 [Penicillium malachiteum]